MIPISYSCSFLVNGKVHNTNYEYSTKNISDLFNVLIQSAQHFADSKNGFIKIERTENSLYINYLDVPNTNVIDRIYKVMA